METLSEPPKADSEPTLFGHTYEGFEALSDGEIDAIGVVVRAQLSEHLMFQPDQARINDSGKKEPVLTEAGETAFLFRAFSLRRRNSLVNKPV